GQRWPHNNAATTIGYNSRTAIDEFSVKVAKYSDVKDFWEPSSDSLFADTVWFAVQTDDIAVFSSTSVLDCMGNVEEV
ncbi:Hypothetical predicted protein, partial [Mytilus galloprovincialis]